VPQTIIDLTKKKVITAFVDGDRGGNLIIKELTGVGDVDYVTRAPDGKEVEEITKKEIHKALRSRISGEQAKFELARETREKEGRGRGREGIKPIPQRPVKVFRPAPRFVKDTRVAPTPVQKQKFKEMLENLIGTRGAQILDEKLAVLGKVPLSELQTTLTSLNSGVYAIVFDGIIDRDLAKTAEKIDVKFLIGMESKVRSGETKVEILTVNDL